MSLECQYGCVFCRTGKENVVAKYLIEDLPGIKAVVPVKMRYRRSHGITTEEWVVLFPGYVFFEYSLDSCITKVVQHKDIFRLLQSESGNWILQGSDKSIVRQFISFDGKIGISKACYVGDRIKIIEGFLKHYEGNIIRVNHRAKTAQIRVALGGKLFYLWVGFELIA